MAIDRLGLDQETMAALRAVARPRRYPPGAVICRQGEPARRLELIEQGRALATVTTAAGTEIALGFLSAGDVSGELAVLSRRGSEHFNTVTAIEETVTFPLGPDEFDWLREQHPALAGLVIEALALQLERIGRSLVHELAGTAEERILGRLLALHSASESELHDGWLPITQEDLGRLAGVARGTVNRVLRREAAVGTVRLGRGRVAVVDAAAMRARIGVNREPMAQAGRPTKEAPRHRRVVTALAIELDLQAGNRVDVELTNLELARYQAAVQTAIERFGGTFLGFQGGTAVAVFGYPLAQGDDSHRAVIAAAAALDSVAKLNQDAHGWGAVARCGVDSGEAVLADSGEPHLRSGTLLQRAAQLRSAARAGTVLVGEAVYEATHRDLSFERVPFGWVHLGSLPARPVRAPFVGRSAEFALLSSLWQAVIAERRPRLITILGPPGIGKSRLATELCMRVESAAGRVLRGRSASFGGGLAYGAFTSMVCTAAGISDAEPAGEALEKLSSAVRAAASGRQEEIVSHLALMTAIGETSATGDQQALFRSACIFIEGVSRSTPHLLLFEDLHWADASLQDLVEALAARVRDVPVLILCTARPELLDRRPAWSGGLSSAVTIELEGLGAEAAAELTSANLPANHRADVVAQVVNLAEGNPLFIEELAANVAERGESFQQLPPTVQNAIAARLDALPAPARTTLINASVIGRNFWRGALARLVQRPDLDSSLEVLVRRDLIRRESVSTFPDDDEYVFKHVLVREVAYSTLTRTTREQAHAEVARFLERKASDRAVGVASLLAHHWREAGQLDRSFRYLVEAAERASRAAAHREAVTLFREAARLAYQLGRPEAAELRARLGVALARIGRWQEARPELEAADHAELEPPERRIQVMIELALVCHWLLDLEGCRAAARKAVELARASQREDLEAAALGALAVAESSAGHVNASLEQMQASIETAGERRLQLMGPTVEVCALTLYWVGRHQEAVEKGRAALQLGEEFADVNTSIRALGNLGLALAGCGRYTEALRTFDEARTFAENYGTGTFLARALAMCGGVHLDLLDFEGARALAEEARELAASLSFSLPMVSAGIDLIFNWARVGEGGRAEALLPEVEEAVATAQGAHGWLWRLRFAQARAESAAAHGRWDEAWRSAARAVRRGRLTGRVKYVVAGLGVQAKTLAVRNQKRRALAVAGQALKLAEAAADPAMIMRAATVCLELEPDDQATLALRDAVASILAGLPEGALRERFTKSVSLVRLAPK